LLPVGAGHPRAFFGEAQAVAAPIPLAAPVMNAT
jgi:hypothetical protein